MTASPAPTLPRIVIVGASSAIAVACARQWLAEQPCDVVLVGRDPAKLTDLAADLAVRSPSSRILWRVADFLDPAHIAAEVEQIVQQGVPQRVLIAHGSLPDQAVCQQDLPLAEQALFLNGISPCLFAEAFARHLQTANRGTLGVIGSVAGDRGRKSNYVYGAAKGMVTRYVQGLQHRLAHSGVKVVLIKPGPTDTPMTAHLKRNGAKLASVEQVAGQIVAGMARGQACVYAPGKWALIMLVIRHLPAFVFNKMDI